MAIFRSFNDLVIAFVDYLRLVQPELDTKPGTVARDLFVDTPSQQIAELYTQLRNISSLQSLFASGGSDLNKFASNFGISRKSGTAASGPAVLTTNSLDSNILIPSGSIIIASNGISYQIINNSILNAASLNVYRATATRLREELNLASITDPYAVEVMVEALTTGSSGNIGSYSLRTHNISGISNVTNLQGFTGGSNPEGDDAFRTRILGIFAGSNTGTALGYTNVIESISGILDSIIVVPGDPLLIRDGTQVTTDNSGNFIVSELGSGGKVDIYILGSRLSAQIDTFIYSDKSGRNNSVDLANDIVLGQKGQATTISAMQRRISLIGANNLPYQPINKILTVVGSSSGANFIEKYIDSNGITHGNYELIKDSGDFSGSSFGFDKLRWISNKIELSNEEITKGAFNGGNELDFSDVDEISSITQEISVFNENSVTNNLSRSSVMLKHTPIKSVSRIVNLTTGERYVVEYQNPDGNAGELNITGNITISGNTLPVNTDILQVDYVWVKLYDRVHDFDNLKDYNKFRSAQDSVDWSFGNLVCNESATIIEDDEGNLGVTVSHPIYKVVSVLSYETDTSTVVNGVISMSTDVSGVLDIKRVSDGAELFNTDSMGGSLSGASSITLPADTVAVNGDQVIVRFNTQDLFSPVSGQIGTFAGNIIIFPQDVGNVGGIVSVNYVSNVSTLIEKNNISYLPAVRRENKFVMNDVVLGEQPTSNLFDGGGNIINNIRRADSNLRVSVSAVTNPGSITILGTTIHKITDALVVVTSGSGFEANLQSAVLSNLGSSFVPSTIKIVKLYKLERVNLDGWNNISSVDNIYDIKNYKLKDNSRDISNAIKDTSLTDTSIVLPQTINNVNAMLNTGDVIRVTFYYVNTNDNETLYFSKNGELITDKLFSIVDKMYISYGFKNAVGVISGAFTVKNLNQPIDNTIYKTNYNYMAPKENERITTTYNYNILVNEATMGVEDVRPITADILIKEAKLKNIDASIRIVLLPEFVSQEQTILQDAVNAVITLLSSSSLGTTVDSSDVINVLYSIRGVDRVRIFNFSHEYSGNVLSITAERNEYLNAGTIDIQVEER